MRWQLIDEAYFLRRLDLGVSKPHEIERQEFTAVKETNNQQETMRGDSEGPTKQIKRWRRKGCKKGKGKAAFISTAYEYLTILQKRTQRKKIRKAVEPDGVHSLAALIPRTGPLVS